MSHQGHVLLDGKGWVMYSNMPGSYPMPSKVNQHPSTDYHNPPLHLVPDINYKCVDWFCVNLTQGQIT